MLTLLFVTITKLQLWNTNKILWLGVTTTWGTVLKGCSIRKVENRWFRRKTITVISYPSREEKESYMIWVSSFSLLFKIMVCFCVSAHAIITQGSRSQGGQKITLRSQSILSFHGGFWARTEAERPNWWEKCFTLLSCLITLIIGFHPKKSLKP